MIVKQNEAMAKLCPLMRGVCRGADCMMWRWAEEPAAPRAYRATPGEVTHRDRPDFVPPRWTVVPGRAAGTLGPADEGAPDLWQEPQADADARARAGFCGVPDRKPDHPTLAPMPPTLLDRPDRLRPEARPRLVQP